MSSVSIKRNIFVQAVRVKDVMVEAIADARRVRGDETWAQDMLMKPTDGGTTR